MTVRQYIKEFFSAYGGVRKIFRRYWEAYGGTRELVRSPYFQISVLLSAIMFPAWSPSWPDSQWWNIVISVMPNILGFSLGGYAIWLGFGDEKFKSIISVNEEGETLSAYLKVNAAFVHFIILQVLSVLTALIARSMYFTINESNVIIVRMKAVGVDVYAVLEIWSNIGCFFGYWLFIYAILAALAAAMQVFRVSSWYDYYQNKKKDKMTSEGLLQKILDILEKK